MKKNYNYLRSIVFLCLIFPLTIQAQSDCSNAVQVCSNVDFTFDPSGIGALNDFANPANNTGCLSGEFNSYWIEITFDSSMPPGTLLEFTATTAPGGPVADTDFAMWGPNPDCNNLGSPIRCNFSSSDIAGLSNSSGDSGYDTGLLVNPCETYLILVDDFGGDNGLLSFTWDASLASNFLTCTLIPLTVDLGVDQTVCEETSFSLSPTVTGNTGGETYTWTASPVLALSYLSATNILSPAVNLPIGQAVNATYTLTVTNGGCTAMDDIIINTVPLPVPVGTNVSFCSGGDAILDPGSFASYVWSNTSTSPTITVNTAGTYTVTVTDNNTCTAEASFVVTENASLNVQISGGPQFCAGGSVDLMATAGFNTYAWSTAESSQTINVSVAGTYTVTVTDANMCTGTASIDITEAANQTVTIMPSGVLCTNGAIDLDADIGYSSYVWSTTESSQTININTPGTYTVTVQDAGGCTYDGTIDITQAPPLTPQINGTLDFCTGLSTTLSVSGGAFTGYEWQDGSINSNITISSPGLVFVTVTDANGCTGEISVNVIENSLPTPTITGDNTICPGIASVFDAGAGYSSYSWTGGGSGQTNAYSAAGTYFVTVTDGNSCEGVTSVVITENASPSPNITGVLSICQTGNTSSVLDAGVGFSNYNWSPTGDNTQTITASAAGSYTVTVTDAEGCEGEQTVQVDLFNTTDPVITGDNTLCPNQSTGLDAGADFSTYIWSPSGNAQQITVNTTGTYSVTVTDNNGCETNSNFVINQADVPVPEITGDLFFCEDGFTILNGTSGFQSYVWTGIGNATGAQYITAFPGQVELTVTNNEGCEGVVAVQVEQADSPEPSIFGSLSLCEGQTSMLGVDAGYTGYNWSSGQNTAIIEIDQVGEYIVTVTDNFGCQGIDAVFIEEGDAPIVSIIGEDQFCEGGDVLLDAGFGEASYLWTGGFQNSVIVVNAGGTYTVTVTNNAGCQGEASITVTENPNPVPNISGDLTICEGDTSILEVQEAYSFYEWFDGTLGAVFEATIGGVISVQVVDENNCVGIGEVNLTVAIIDELTINGLAEVCEGGTTTLTANGSFSSFVWSDGQNEIGTGQTLDVTEPGTYSVMGINASGCTAQSEELEVILQPTNIDITGVNTFCEGEFATLTVTPGFATYQWSHGVAGQEIDVTDAATYSVTATSASGCTAETQIEIVTFPAAAVEIVGSTTFCPGGAAILSANAVFQVYEWSDNNNGTEQSLTVTTEGSYILMVTDDNGCIAADTILVAEQAELSPVISGNLEYCEDGSTLLDVGAGYASYAWTTGDNSSTALIDEAGEVTVLVTDDFGCSGQAVVDIIENPLPTVSIDGDAFFCAGDSATVFVDETFETYLWSNGETGNSIFVQTDGIIELVVVDENGCEGTGSFVIEEKVLPIPEIDGNLSFCPNTETTLFGETGFVTYEWSGGEQVSSLDVTVPGQYILTVEDEFGCTGSNSADVQNYAVENPQISGILTFCPDDTTTLQVINSFETYTWSTNGLGSEIEVVNEGLFSVSVTDTNACETSAEVETTHFLVVDPQISGQDEFCSEGQVTLDAGTGFATYQWSNTQSVQNIDVLEGGQYGVTVIDVNGCESSDVFLVTEHPLPDVNIGGSSSYCIGSFTTLNGGATYATYLWSTGSVESSIEVNTVGSISLMITDEFGCEGGDAVEITEDTQLNPVISGDLAYCQNENTTLDAGAGFSTYHWSDGSNDSFDTTLIVNQPGTYSLTVTDAGGCVGEAIVEVIENPLPVPQISGTLEFCTGNSTMLDAGSGYDSYSWSNGSLEQTIEVDSAGIYVVEVSNEFSCLETTNIAVIERTLPVFTIEGIDFFCEGSATNVTVSNTFQTYQWTNNDTAQTTEITNPGAIGVNVINEFGCERFEEILIEEIELPIAAAGDDQNLDCAILITNIGSFATSTGDDFTYLWTGPGITAANGGLLQPEVNIDGQYSLVVTDTVHNCVSAISVTEIVDLAYVPVVELNADNELDCLTEEVQIDASNSTSGPDIEYRWFDKLGNLIVGATEPSLNVDEAGMYALEVMDMATHCVNIDSIQINQNIQVPFAEAGNPGHLDCNILSYTLDATLTETGDNISYQWTAVQGQITAGNNTLNPSVNEPGIYVLTVINEDNGCESMDNVLVDQNIIAPTVDAGNDQELDCHNEFVTIDASGTPNNGNFAFQWTFEGDEIAQSNLIFEVSEPGLYQIFVQNLDNGCTAQSEVMVTIDENTPTGFDFQLQNPTCLGDTDGSIQITEIIGGLAPFLYSVNNAPFVSNAIFQNLDGGIYSITIQDLEGCEYEQELLLEDGNDLSLDLGDDIYINLGQTADVEAEINLDAAELASIIWQTPDSLNCANPNCLAFTVLPLITTSYEVTVIDENNCVRTDEVTVFVNKPRDVFVPNVFSPNGDGINDVLTILGATDIEYIHSFVILNRWGDVVFQVYDFPPNDPVYGWTGDDRGKVFNAQVFTYFTEVEFIDGEVVLFKGDVTLMK